MQEKQCTKCKNKFPATLEFFYKNSGGKFGITPRCKSCVNKDNLLSHQKRLSKNPELVRKQGNERAKKSYFKNLEQNQERQRKQQAKYRVDPERYALIQSRKRAGGAGLTPEEIEKISKNQNHLCAICSDPAPTDLDHCHKTGQVRWLLCKHCNRGLGAFRDNPEWLEKAASMIRNARS